MIKIHAKQVRLGRKTINSIRQMYSEGYSNAELATIFREDHTVISQVLNGAESNLIKYRCPGCGLVFDKSYCPCCQRRDLIRRR